MSPRPPTGAVLVAAAVLLVACGPPGTPSLELGEARAAEPVAGSSQIVLDVTNHGDGDDRLLEVETDAAVAVEIHETRIEEGRATMQQLDEVPLPAGATVRFRPGGLHLMLVAPDESVELGGTFPLSLRFAESGEVTLPVEVVDQLDLAESTFDTDADPGAGSTS